MQEFQKHEGSAFNMKGDIVIVGSWVQSGSRPIHVLPLSPFTFNLVSTVTSDKGKKQNKITGLFTQCQEN